MAADDVAITETAASVLGFLSIGPLTGWDLNNLAQVSVGHFWNMTRSQIYRELASLERVGLVEAETVGARNARRFHLTQAGRQRLRRWLRELPDEPIERNPFLVKMFFADHLSPAERRRLVAHARAKHEAALATLREAVVMADELSPFAAATARYGVAVHEAILAWFDDAPWSTGS